MMDTASKHFSYNPFVFRGGQSYLVRGPFESACLQPRSQAFSVRDSSAQAIVIERTLFFRGTSVEKGIGQGKHGAAICAAEKSVVDTST